jgi:hypothetical protein
VYLAIITLPLLGSIVSGFFGRKVGVSGAQLITSTCVIVTTLLAIVAFFEVGLNNIPVSIHLFRWIDSESLNVSWGFHFDSLTVCFVGLFYIREIEAVLVLIQLYKKVLDPILLISCLWGGGPLFELRANSNNFASSTIYKIRNKGINYSTISNVWSKSKNKEEISKGLDFIPWFAGFTDAEGNFIINPTRKKDKRTISSFSFMFKITLHLDDEKVLRFIRDRLGIGGVRIYKDECIFNVTDQRGIALLIYIFDKYNLNTTKYLDYLDFKEAFLLYLNRDKNLNRDIIIDKMLELKNKMNTNRIYFNRPEDSKIVITKCWLLGFIEGDGSFFLRRDNLTPTFSIQITGVQFPVIIAIKEFLEDSLGFDLYSLYKLKNSSTIAIANTMAKNNTKSKVSLTIKNIYVLNNYFIPLFDDMVFLTKKMQDFKDFKLICQIIYTGGHREEDIRFLILKLSNTMNNFRLSTYKGAIGYLSKEEWEKLLHAKPTVEHLLDGRVVDRTSQKVLPRLNSCVYQISELNGVFILANSLREAASIVGLYPDTLGKYLDIELNSEGVCSLRDLSYTEIKKYKVRRIRAFYPKSFSI